MNRTAKLFNNGGSQAVRLPADTVLKAISSTCGATR